MTVGTEKATGFATAGTASAGLTWINYPNLLTFLTFVSTLLATAWAWYLLRVDEKKERDRNQRLLDTIQAMAIGQLEMGVDQARLAAMIERLLHPDKPKPKDSV